MANDLLQRKLAEAMRAYSPPIRDEQIRHACPDCPLGQPRPLCPTCLGAGAIEESDLARWVMRKNAEAR